MTATHAFTTVVASHILTLTVPAVLDHAVYLPLVAGNFSTTPPATPDVRITTIEYDPPGDAVQDEYVRIQNFTATAQADMQQKL